LLVAAAEILKKRSAEACKRYFGGGDPLSGDRKMKKLVLCFTLSISLVLTGMVPCQAEQGSSLSEDLREARKEAGKDFKKAGKEVKKGGKETSRKLGEAGREVSKELKKDAKKADKDAGNGFSRSMKELRTNASKSWTDFRKFLGWD
jgi:hypothetical protein